MYLIILFTLLIMALQDYKYGIVSNLLFIPLLFFIKFNVVLVMSFIFFIFIYKYISYYIGGADIKLLFSFFSIFSFNDVILFLLVSLSIALCYSFCFKKKEIRMFPFFFISYCVVIFQ